MRSRAHGGEAVSVLVADDDPNVLDILARFFRGMGTAADVVATGREAIERMKSGPPDLLVVDLAMPGFSGLDVLRDILELGVETKVIVVSGHVDEVVARMCRELGADGVLAKPFDLDEMEAVLGPHLRLDDS